jgi:hypothetical protein
LAGLLAWGCDDGGTELLPLDDGGGSGEAGADEAGAGGGGAGTADAEIATGGDGGRAASDAGAVDLDAAAPGDDAGAARHPLEAVRPVGEMEPIFLGVWGAADDDVWFAGGIPGAQEGVLAHFDGETIRRVPLYNGGSEPDFDDDGAGDNACLYVPGGAACPQPPVLWWVFGLDADNVWVGGEDDTILHFDGETWRAEYTGGDDGYTVWGIWGSSIDDMWAVGGSTDPGGPQGVVLKRQGRAWFPVDDPAIPQVALYKVWGSGPDDVFIVGADGTTLRWDGAAFEVLDGSGDDLLFTVHGRSDGPVLAVGGTMSGVALSLGEDGWIDESEDGWPSLNGVFVGPSGDALVTGARGFIAAREPDGTWTRFTQPSREGGFSRDTLHAVWAGTDIWAVGGDLLTFESGLIVTDRAELPELELALPAPPDAGVPGDAGPPRDAEVVVDADMVQPREDAAAPDAAVVDVDAAAPEPDAAAPAVDAATQDAAVVAVDAGAAAPDAAVVEPDAAGVEPDAAGVAPDAAVVAPDAAVVEQDAAVVVPDAAPPELDAAIPVVDAEVPEVDAEVPIVDAAPPDSGLPGPGASCEFSDYQCAPGLFCREVLAAGEILCMELCDTPADCGPGYGPNPCCERPGFQEFNSFCIPRDVMPDGLCQADL